MGFGVYGLGFGVEGLLWGLGFSLGFRVQANKEAMHKVDCNHRKCLRRCP